MENVKYRREAQHFFGQALTDLKSAFTLKSVLFQLLFAAVSVLLSCSSAFDGLSPFGMAAIMSVPSEFTFAVFIGSCAGSFLTQPGVLIIRYTVSAACLWIIRSRIIGKKSQYSEVWFIPPLVSFFVCAATGLAFSFSASVSSEYIPIFLGEAVLCGFTVYFFKKTISFIRMIQERRSYSAIGISCVAVSFGILIICLDSLNINSFSPARTLACFCAMACSYAVGEAAGSVCGVTASFSLYASSGGESPIFPLALSGLISGIFSPLGKAGCAISFSLVYSVLCFFSDSFEFPTILIECAVAVILFVAIPKSLYKSVSLFFKSKGTAVYSENIRENVSAQLYEAAQTIGELSVGITDISEKLKKINNSDDKNVYCRIREDFCTKCEHFHDCWETNFAYTLRMFNELSELFHENNRIYESDLPKLFSDKCEKKSELINKTEYLFIKNRNAASEEIKLSNMRELLSDQMKCTSEMLTEFSKKFNKCTVTDNVLSSDIKEMMKDSGVNATKATCTIDARGIMTITVKAKKISKSTDKAKIKSDLESITFRKFNDAEFSFLENGITIVFRQKPWMNFVTGKAQLSSEDSSICGDCCRELNDKSGKYTLIISDGMGTGGRAAVDASMASEYFSNLIGSGISCNCALKIVNSALSVKSTNESLATIDVASVDLFSGKVDFFKAGAAVSFVRKSGKCEIIESVSLPAGILRDISFATDSVTLCKGDIIVMVSDGVTNYGTDWIIKEIESWNHSDPEKLAQRIIGTVCDKSREDRRDDITVIAGIMTA